MPSCLDIIIVNWNTGGLLRACADSLPSACVGDLTLSRVVVVDNDSTDNSADGLSDGLLPITIIRNPVNRGFAAACNQGATDSNADYLLFLNPDTRLSAISLAPAIAFMDNSANRRVGVLGARLIGKDGETQRNCARAPTPGRLVAQAIGLDRAAPRLFPPHFMMEWDHADTRPVDQVMGAFLLIRRELFIDLGGFDERFFVYYDDVDLCLRARQAGWGVVHFAQAQAYHLGGGASDKVRDMRLFYLLRSRILFAFKHFSFTAALAVAGATLILEPMARLALALAQRSGRDARAALGGTGRLWRAAPRLLADGWRRR